MMYFLSGVIALVGAALVICLASLSPNGLTGGTMYSNSLPLITED